jgi:hypothetical protein
VLESLRLDIDALDITSAEPKFDYHGIIKMEEITTNPNLLDELVSSISKKTITSDDKYLSKVNSLRKINKHDADRISSKAEDLFNQFMPWQQEILIHYLQRYEIIKAYEEYGYDFDFLEGCQSCD